MKNKWVRIAAVAAVACALLIGVTTHFVTSSSPQAVKAAGNFGSYASLSKLQKRLVSGFVSSELDAQNIASANTRPHNYYPYAGNIQCGLKIGSNIKVNQNCVNLTDANLQGRAQANNETSIAIDPMNPQHIVASDNDYRRGDGNCIGAYSLDAGHTWNDTLVPMGFTSGTAFGGVAREYWEAGGDTAVAWDTKGNVYFQCQMFQRGAGGVTNNHDASSAVYVFRSTGNYGASWNFPAHPVIEFSDPTGTAGVLEDKPLMTVDNHIGSPYQDRIYDTYTEFAADGTAYIWESYSSDYGQTFSKRTLVSTTSALCNNTFGVPTPQGTCNENQFSQPFTGPDGALYVAWANFNLTAVPSAPSGNATTTAGIDNHYQMLLAKSVDGGATFSAPVKVGDYYDLPDCATYQGGADLGRSCVPEKGSTMNSIFRATNYPVGSVNPMNKNEVVVTFGSYINKNSNEKNGCIPQGFSPTTGNPLYTGVKTPGACNNDILVSTSLDGGATFTGTSTDPRHLTSVNQSAAQAKTDQWWQWATFTANGKFVVSYYDRQYGTDENTGYSDMSISASKNVATFATQRVTSSSMPPPTQFSGLFFGDYTGLDATNSTAYPLWMDTRDPELFLCPGTGATGAPPKVCTASATNASRANDQDIFVAAMPVTTP